MVDAISQPLQPAAGFSISTHNTRPVHRGPCKSQNLWPIGLATVTLSSLTQIASLYGSGKVLDHQLP